MNESFLISLKKINLSGCGLTKFPSGLTGFIRLEELNLSNNPLGDSNISFFSELMDLRRLKKLNLSGCGLKQFHRNFDFWQLEELDLSNNALGNSSMDTAQLRMLFDDSGKSILDLFPMIWLKKLNLSNCGFKTWPHVVHRPLNLEELNLSNNFINHQQTFESLAGSLSLQNSDEPLELAPIGLGFFSWQRE